MHVLGWWMGYNQVGWFILNGIKLHENCWSCTQKQMENIPSYSWFVPCQLWKGFGESGSELLAAGYLLFVAIVFNGFPPDDARLICPIVPRWSLPPFPEKKMDVAAVFFFQFLPQSSNLLKQFGKVCLTLHYIWYSGVQPFWIWEQEEFYKISQFQLSFDWRSLDLDWRGLEQRRSRGDLRDVDESMIGLQ